MIATFDACRVDLDRIEIHREGVLVDVQPQVFTVLAYLLEHRERVVSKHELLDNVWGDRFVSESALTSRIKSLRRALGDDGVRQDVIKTVHGRGYRLVADVRWTASSNDATPESAASHAPTSPASTRSDMTPAPRWPLVGRTGLIHDVVSDLERLQVDGRREHHGVCLSGPDRSGRSRLLAEVGRELRDRSIGVMFVDGSVSSSEIPLSAIDHLLGDEPGLVDRDETDPTSIELAQSAVLRRAVASVQARLGGSPTLVIIDDADRLDDLSAAVLASLTSSGAIDVAIGVRRGAERHGVWQGLVASGRLRHLELEPLDAAAVDALLHRHLGGPLDIESLERMVDVSTGLPGVLVDVVETSVRTGSLVEHDGVWRLVGPLRSAASVAWPPAGLSPSAQAAAEQLALLGSVGIELATELLGEPALDELDGRRLVALGTEVSPTLRLTDPLLDATVIDSIPPLRARRYREQLLDQLVELPTSPSVLAAVAAWDGDPLARWDADVVIDNAFSALVAGDVAVAAALVGALGHLDDPVVAVISAEVAIWRGQPDVAEKLLDDIDVDGLDEYEAALAVRRRASLAFTHRGRHDDTIGWLLEAAGSRTGDFRGLLTARLANLLAAAHRYDDLLAMRDRFDDLGVVATAEVKAALSFALAGQGRFTASLDMLAMSEAALAEIPDIWTQDVRDSIVVLRCSSLQMLGRQDEAAAIARGVLPGGQITRLGFAPAVAADIELGAGRPRSARELLRPARAGALRRTYPQYRSVIDAISARCELALGHVDVARRRLAESLTTIDLATGAARSRAAVWVAQAYLDLGESCPDIGLETIAERSAELGSRLSEMEVRCVQVALDPTPRTARRLVDRVESVAGAFDGELWPIRVRAVRARAAGRDLDGIADEYEQLGYVHLAERARNGR